jgi:hypothetical protein
VGASLGTTVGATFAAEVLFAFKPFLPLDTTGSALVVMVASGAVGGSTGAVGAAAGLAVCLTGGSTACSALGVFFNPFLGVGFNGVS